MSSGRPPRRTPRVTVMVLAMALVLATCSRSGPELDGSAPSSSTTSEAPAPSFAPTTGTTPSTIDGDGSGPGDGGAGGPSPGACADAGPVPPPGATEVTEVTADVDGDGSDDRVVSYQRADGTRRVGTDLAAGGTAAVDAGNAGLDGPVALRVLGGADLGGDGETVLAVTGAGASVIVVGLFQFVECAITPLVFSSGQTVALPVGGGITHGDGLVCTGGGLTTLSAMSSDGENFTTTDTRYRVDGNTLVQVGTESGTLARPGDSAALDRYSTLDCPGLDRGIAG